MKLPKTLNILGIKYTVIEEDINLQNQEYVLGLCIPYQNNIYINSNLIEEIGHRPEQTLIHEIIHAVLHRNGITQKLSEPIEEVICESIANCIVDNFELKNKKIK